MQYLDKGFDPLVAPNDCITRAQVGQLVDAALPNVTNKIGFTITADAAPDVVTNPELSNFIWLKSVAGVRNGEFYYYNGTSWTLLSVVDGALISDGTIPLDKIDLTGAVNLDLIQVNGSGVLAFVSIANAFAAGSLAITKLAGGGAGNKFFTSVAGTNTWSTGAAMAALLTNGDIPVLKIAAGGVGDNAVFVSLLGVNQYVTIDAFMALVSAGIIDITKLSGNGGSALQAIRRNAANNAWQWFTPAAGIDYFNTVSGVSATLDVTLVKPTANAWKDVDITFTGSYSDNAVTGGNVSVAFTWQTAPVAGNALTNGAALGCGNSGQVFSCANNDDMISPTWHFKGVIDAGLLSTDSIVIRATLTNASGLTVNSQTFAAKGSYA